MDTVALYINIEIYETAPGIFHFVVFPFYSHFVFVALYKTVLLDIFKSIFHLIWCRLLYFLRGCERYDFISNKYLYATSEPFYQTINFFLLFFFQQHHKFLTPIVWTLFKRIYCIYSVTSFANVFTINFWNLITFTIFLPYENKLFPLFKFYC